MYRIEYAGQLVGYSRRKELPPFIAPYVGIWTVAGRPYQVLQGARHLPLPSPSRQEASR